MKWDLNPGDIVDFTGTFRGKLNADYLSGTATKPIIIRGNATFSDADTYTGTALSLEGARFVTIDGLRILGSKVVVAGQFDSVTLRRMLIEKTYAVKGRDPNDWATAAIMVGLNFGGTRLILEDSIIQDNEWSNGIWFHEGGAGGHIVRRNIFRRISINSPMPGGNGGPSAISSVNGGGILIENNTFREISTYAILGTNRPRNALGANPFNVTIRRNYIYSTNVMVNDGGPIYFSGGADAGTSTVEYNYINGYGAASPDGSRQQSCIYYEQGTGASNRILAHSNVLRNCDVGFALNVMDPLFEGPESGHKNLLSYNNTIIGCSSGIGANRWPRDESYNINNVQFRNNLIDSGELLNWFTYELINAERISSSNNIPIASSGRDSAFVGYANGDYRLRAGSSYDHAGAPISGYTSEDYVGAFAPASSMAEVVYGAPGDELRLPAVP